MAAPDPIVRNRSGEGCPPRGTTAAAAKPSELVLTDPDLARLVEAWPRLADPIRRGIRAIVEVAVANV